MLVVVSDTVWPMAVGFVAKLLLGGLESYLLARNVAQLAIRRMCNSIAAGLASVSLLLFVRPSTIGPFRMAIRVFFLCAKRRASPASDSAELSLHGASIWSRRLIQSVHLRESCGAKA